MFERFTERARQVVVLAQEEARQLRHDYIGTEHILLGLIREEEGIAAQVLAGHVDLVRVRTQVVKIVGTGTKDATEAKLPFTPRGKKVFELALREALSRGHNYIGTEHLLLGLVAEPEGVAARVLLDLIGVDYAATLLTDTDSTLKGPKPRGLGSFATAIPSTSHVDWSYRAFGDTEGNDPAQAAQAYLTYDDVRNGVGRLHVVHCAHMWLTGILVSYDWAEDRCGILLDEQAQNVLGVDRAAPKREFLTKR